MPRMDNLPDIIEAFNALTEHLAALPIEAHLAGEQAIIERCNSYLTKALQFWNANRGKVASVEALTTLLSYDYHQVMKTGSRELRHLINIYDVNREELEKIRAGLQSDSSISEIDYEQLKHLKEDGYKIENELRQFIDSAIAGLESSLKELKKASVKVWDKPSLSKSVIPKDLYFFISHATADKGIATEICVELESIGVATWRDDKDIMGGDSIPTEISRGLEKATHFGLLYSNTSKDRPWVKTEFENALMLRERTGKPKIIPLLIDGLMPPTILGNIKGIPFDNFKDGMELLWQSLGIPAGSRVSLALIFKFQQRARNAIHQVKWCNQDKDWLLDMGEETFNELEDIETYVLSFPIRDGEIRHRRFEWTMVSFPEQKTADFSPSYEWNFYTYRRGAIAGGNLLKTMDGIAQRLLAMLEDIEGTPLPPGITDEEHEF